MRTFADKEEALSFIQTLPWGNSAGCCKTEKEVRAYSQTGMPQVRYGSIRPNQYAGNPEGKKGNFGGDRKTGIYLNNFGIPDQGIEYHLQVLPRLKKIANENGSELWVSISAGDGFKPEDYYQMARKLTEAGCADGTEGNYSCSNKRLHGIPEPVVCYNLPKFTEGVIALNEGARTTKKAVKISPITEPGILGGLIQVCIDQRIDYVVAANTVGHCYWEDEDGNPLIDMQSGGLSGPLLRPIIAGMTRLIAPQITGTKTKLIAVGGIQTGADAYFYLKLGADGFGFNTVLSDHGLNPKKIRDIITGDGDEDETALVNILVKKGLPEF